MTLAQNRPQARSFDSAKTVADPQGEALKHSVGNGMCGAIASPVQRGAHRQ